MVEFVEYYTVMTMNWTEFRCAYQKISNILYLFLAIKSYFVLYSSVQIPALGESYFVPAGERPGRETVLPLVNYPAEQLLKLGGFSFPPNIRANSGLIPVLAIHQNNDNLT